MEKRITLYEEESKKKSVLSGAVMLTVSALVVKILGLIYKIPLARFLGEEGMGYFNSAYTVYTCFYIIVSAGVPKAITILLARSSIKGNPSDERKILNTAMKLFFTVGLSLTLLLSVLAGPLSDLIANKGSLYSILAIAPSVLFVAIGSVQRGYLNGKNTLLPISVSQVIEGCGRLVFGLIFASMGIKNGFSLEKISALTIFGTTLGTVISSIYLFFVCLPMLGKSKKRDCSTLKGKEIAKHIVKIAIPITVSAGVMTVTNVIDLGMIMQRLQSIGYSEWEANNLYGAYSTLAVPMFNLAVALITPISIAILPSMTKHYALGRKKEFINSLESTMQLSVFIAIPMAVAFGVFSKEILALLFENSMVEHAYLLLTLLSPAIIFVAPLTIINTALEATGAVRAPLYSMVVGATVKLIFTHYLVGNAEFGISGAPIGTALFYLVSLITSLSVLARKDKSSLRGMLSVWRPLLNSIGSAAISKIIVQIVLKDAETPVKTILFGVVFVGLYLIFSVFLSNISLQKIKNLAICTKEA